VKQKDQAGGLKGVSGKRFRQVSARKGSRRASGCLRIMKRGVEKRKKSKREYKREEKSGTVQ